jgi:HPr kinase/phosphorylase
MSEGQIPHITVGQFLKEHGKNLDLRPILGEDWLHRVIGEPTVNRPGLALAGHTRFFPRHRVQVLGSAEMSYLREQPRDVRERGYQILF